MFFLSISREIIVPLPVRGSSVAILLETHDNNNTLNVLAEDVLNGLTSKQVVCMSTTGEFE